MGTKGQSRKLTQQANSEDRIFLPAVLAVYLQGFVFFYKGMYSEIMPPACHRKWCSPFYHYIPTLDLLPTYIRPVCVLCVYAVMNRQVSIRASIGASPRLPVA